MANFWQNAIFQAVMFLAIAAVLTAAAYRWVRKLRDDSEQDQPQASALLTKFREMHARGSLSDEEFRTIKTKLAAQLEQDLSDRDLTS